jgi:tetratricopeptide (TPR) repeat protein
MSSKQARKAGSASLAPAGSIRQEVEKLIQKDRLKDAVKAAKLCFKDDGSPENHRLLERAYFLRARQLLRLGMADSAIEVAEHLLEFGLTSDEWADDFVRLLMNLGLADEAFQVQGKWGRPELKDQLLVLAADQAVIHPGRMQDTSPEIAREASLIRESLEMIRAGEFESGLMPLRDLPRSSLLSDWKFFARGLAAHYRGENEECQANWGRLDANRKAHRIAERLRQLADGDEASVTDAHFAIVEKEAFGEPVLGRLAELEAFVASQEWQKVTRLLVLLRHSLRRLDWRLAQRLTRILMESFIRAASEKDLDEGERLLNGFTRVAEPMAIDPNWNRFWAIVADEVDDDGETARERWTSYAGELETISAFSPAERPLVEAMIWNRVAMFYRDDAEAIDSPQSMMMMRSMFRRDPEEAEEAARFKKLTVECLERSLGLAPQYLLTHRLLIDAHKHWKNGADLESTAKRLLDTFPNDLETLTLLLDSCVERDLFDEALSYAQKARAQKPLDQSLRDKETFIHIGLARERALAGRWDEGRDQFRDAEELSSELRSQYSFLARKSLFEAKASQRDQSDLFLQQAQAALQEPTPLWMVLAIESIRYGMSAATRGAYAELWAADLKKKCRSDTAGEMASTLHAYLLVGVEYPGRSSHVRQLTAYLKRTTRLKYQQIDIERVCKFLGDLPEQKELLGKLLKLGLKQHPCSTALNFEAGMLAVAKSTPPFMDPAAKKLLEKALELAEASTVATETALLPSIKSTLTMINELGSGPGRSPFGSAPFGFPGADFDPFEFLDLDFEDDRDDDDYDPAPRIFPRPKPKVKKKPKKR